MANRKTEAAAATVLGFAEFVPSSSSENSVFSVKSFPLPGSVAGLVVALAAILGGTAPLRGQGTELPVAANAPVSDAYLLGMLGTSHLLVLHDHVALVVEQGLRAEQRTSASRRLNELSTHCARVAADFERRPRSNPGLAELAAMFHLLRQECDLARSYVGEPTHAGWERFQSVRTSLGSRLAKLTAPSSP